MLLILPSDPVKCKLHTVQVICDVGITRLTVRYTALQFTNMGQGFQGTLDYVLYTTNSLVPTATLELPDEADIKSSRSTRAGLPNETWSSDHIALLAEFQYKQN